MNALDADRFDAAAALAGAAVLSAVYVLGVVVVDAPLVARHVWAAYYAVCLVAALVTWSVTRIRVATWLAAAGYCVLFAAIFYGANGALDALYGAQRRKAHVAESLGGLEPWFMLCPGVLSTALGGAVHALSRRRAGAPGGPAT